MKTFATLILLFLTLGLCAQQQRTHSLRVGGEIFSKFDKFGVSLREEFRFSTDTASNSNIVFFAPGVRYYLSDKSRLQMEYWFFLNEDLNRFSLDWWNDFGAMDTRIRYQAGWDEFQSRGDMIRLFWRFKPDRPLQGFFNPSVDFEVFHDLQTQNILDRYRGGIGNKFRISENMVCTIGVRSQTAPRQWQQRDYLYRFRIVYEI